MQQCASGWHESWPSRVPDQTPDTVAALLRELLPRSARPAGAMLSAAWRAALLAVADGVSPSEAKAGMSWVLNIRSAA